MQKMVEKKYEKDDTKETINFSFYSRLYEANNVIIILLVFIRQICKAIQTRQTPKVDPYEAFPLYLEQN